MNSNSEQSHTPLQWVQELSSAISDEAEALVSADADALLEAVARKETAARALEGLSENEAAQIDKVVIAQLREANLSNAALMQAAQAHASWTLEQLGRLETATTYSGMGQIQPQTVPRYYGSA